MSRFEVLDFLIYRWRYGLGYIAVSIGFISLIVLAAFFAPQGITTQEQASAVTSGALSFSNFSPDMIVNMPYHALQKGSFYLFGVSELTIKLPSLLLAVATAFGLLLLLRVWFKQNVAVLASLVGVTTGPFLFFAQFGTPLILYIFLPTIILLAASMIARNSRHLLFWKILLFTSVALSLYSPMSIYILAALLSAVLLHPHLRQLVLRLSKPLLLAAFLIFLLVVSPVVYAIIQDTSLIAIFLGTAGASFDILASLSTLGNRYFDFIHPSNGIIMRPVYELASMLLIGLGIYRIFTTKYTARSYIVMAWLVLLLPILILNPALTSITFVPFLLLISFGIDYLIRYWYKLFPKNPYARAVGLVPLIILVGSLAISGVDRYYFGYTYGDNVATIFSRDVNLLSDWRKQNNSPTLTIISSPKQADFYKTVAHYNPSWKIQSVQTDNNSVPQTAYVAYLHHESWFNRPTAEPNILVNGAATQADRFYIYKTASE